MRHGRRLIYLAVAIIMSSVLIHSAAAETAAGDISVTLTADGEHCLVREVTILCSELPAYLRDTLKLPRETRIHLQAAQAASYQSVRTVLDIIRKSEFNHAVGYVAVP